jgi:hypothetical protein
MKTRLRRWVTALTLAATMAIGIVAPTAAQGVLRTPAGHMLLPEQSEAVCSMPAPEASPAVACIDGIVVE